MGIRSLVLLSFVAAFSLASSARADVPNPTTGSGGSTSSSTAGAGGAASTYDPNCSAAAEAVAGTTCMACDPTSSCSGLGKDFNLVCQSSAKAAVYCNGPSRNSYTDQNVACSVSVPGGAWSGAAAGAFAAAVALMMRRRRRS